MELDEDLIYVLEDVQINNKTHYVILVPAKNEVHVTEKTDTDEQVVFMSTDEPDYKLTEVLECEGEIPTLINSVLQAEFL